jgi:hypothetical protein
MLWSLGIAVVAILAILGTDRLERPLTPEESKRFGALLREHDYPGARMIALRFAFKLARARNRAQDLMGRADLRLVRLGWDPAEVSLVRRLCRLVWSEWTHAIGESDTARKAEEGFLREMEATEGLSVKSIEQQAAERETRELAQSSAGAQLEKLRESLEKAGDKVNLIWLDFTLKGETDLQRIAKRTGRNVEEFYRAADRRKRHVKRVLGAQNGVEYEEDT